MKRFFAISLAASVVCASASTVQAHELWFQPLSGKAAVVRLTFADSPAPGEAERVAEISHAKVWGDGTPLEVKRLPDGLEARIPSPTPTVMSAYADRGVVDYMGDSFIITLAAYAQSKPIKLEDSLKLGLDDDQLRLLLVASDSGRSMVRAVWKGKPVADMVVEVFLRDGKPAEVRTDIHGEIPCPDLASGPVSLLAAMKIPAPGKRGGRDYSHIRYKATLAISPEPSRSTDECLARVKEIHGGAGPWAVVGYRMGERAMVELGLPRHSFSLMVVHRSPAEVQYSCMADGLQAATGASPGKLNLKLEPVPAQKLTTVIEDRKTHRRLTFTLRPDLAKMIHDLPFDQLEKEGRRVSELPDDAIFTMTKTNTGS